MIINNLFSIFDPSSSYMSSLWVIALTPIVAFNNTNNLNNNNIENIFNTINNIFFSEINQLIENNTNITPNTITNIFILTITINIIAIFPFNFTPTAHISISFTLNLSLWASTMLYGWNNQFSNIITHLTPIGTPNQLINFIVVIEVVSSLIRPITLSVRLSANIVAGHLLMSLLSSFSIINQTNIIISIFFIIILSSLELTVAIIQAYVISTLLILYQNETTQ